MEVYIEDLVDYCVMHNWYDPTKDSAEEKWTKPDKAMACLPASLSPAARSIYKYSLGLTEEDQKKPHSVLAALIEFYGASIRVSGERHKFLGLIQKESCLSFRGKQESATRAHNASTRISLTSL